MSDRVIIQVALNERIGKAQNPYVPITPEEIARDAIDCVNAGAAIVHFHPRDPATGDNRSSDVALYRRSLAPIRAATDAIFYPTAGYSDSLAADLAHVLELARSPGRETEMYAQGVGAWSLAARDPKTGAIVRDNAYLVSHAALAKFLGEANAVGLKVVLMAHELGHVRSILMLREAGLLPGPLAVQFNFCESQCYGPRPDASGISAYLGMLPAGTDPVWFVQTLGGAAHHRINALAIAMGGHPRIGIGDGAPESKPMTNAQLVERAVAQARALGREPTSPAEAREMLGLPARSAR